MFLARNCRARGLPADGMAFAETQWCLHIIFHQPRAGKNHSRSLRRMRIQHSLFIKWFCVLKTNKTTPLFSIPILLPCLSYIPFANLWWCLQNYYPAKIIITCNGDFCHYKTKANAGFRGGVGSGEREREGLCISFSCNVLFMLISYSFVP